MHVKFSFSTTLFVNSNNWWLVLGSKAAVCSSNNNNSGFWIVAIKKLSVCLWPPERLPANVFSLSDKPFGNWAVSSLNSARCFFRPLSFNPLFWPRLVANNKFSATVILGAVPILGSWNTWAIYLARLTSDNLVKSWLFRTTWPEVVFNDPLITFNKVDLPAPFVPSNVTKSPFSKVKFKSFKILFSSGVPIFTVVLMFFNSSATWLMDVQPLSSKLY